MAYTNILKKYNNRFHTFQGHKADNISGSELFLVWSQGNTPDVAHDFNTSLSKNMFDNIFNDKAKNILLMKLTYRFLK